MSDDKNDDLFYDDREWNNIKSWKEDGWSCTLIQALSAWSPGDVIENTHSTVNLIKHARAEITRLHAENEKLDDTRIDYICKINKLVDEREDLRKILQALINDIEDYEHINNITPKFSKLCCVESIRNAREILKK